jgi:hypothetical protein
VFPWAAIGHEDKPPGRVEVVVCEHRAVLVAVERADRHVGGIGGSRGSPANG